MAMLRDADFRKPDAPSPDTVLSVQDLSIDFNLRTHVLHAARNVSFDLHRGRTLCLVGESGSGKSVTARALLRIIDRNGAITSGRILLRGGKGSDIDIAKLDERSRTLLGIRGGRIGLIFQEPMSSLSPVHTIGSQIVEALRLHQAMDKRQARAATIELLRQVEIPNPETQIDRYTFEFSGGMRQRAMIAMALRLQPRHPHRRRTHHSARRHHPGRNSRPHQAPAGEPRHGHAAHHPRHGGGRRGG